jgi:hypothetical protein
MSAEESYKAGEAARLAERDALDRRSRAVGTTRLFIVLSALGLLGGIVWGHLPPFTWGVVVALVLAFVGLVIVHARVEAKKSVAAAGARFHARGLARLDGRWRTEPGTPFEKGDPFVVANHPYADDLDVFGQGSIFHRLSQAQTRFGAAELAFWLKGGAASVAEARARQAAVRDLTPRSGFRERLYALGAQLGEDKPDPGPVLEWAEGKLAFEAPAAMRLVFRVLPVLTIASIALAGVLPRGMWLGMIALQLAVTTPFRSRASRIAQAVGARESGLARYGDMLAEVEREPFEAEALVAQKAALAASGANATLEMRRLARIVSFVEARQNEVFRLFVAPLLLWDIQCVMSLERWRARCGRHVRGWLDVLGAIEALASLSTLSFEDPGAVFPELSDAPVFEAEGLAHPLLDAGRRVGNDVVLSGPGQGLVVTGSNMSGKSTLLRALGASAVLALAGGAVVARRLRIGPLRVVTSMRIADSLERGISHFFAELQRLKLVLDMSSGAEKSGKPPVFFLLDEILHGTNARERLIGARAVVRGLVSRGAMGAVSTHDLAIGELEAELPGQVRNVHFEERVDGDTMTFDFLLKNGVVQSSNALRLMRIIGIDVPLPRDGEPETPPPEKSPDVAPASD